MPTMPPRLDGAVSEKLRGAHRMRLRNPYMVTILAVLNVHYRHIY